MSVSLHRHCLAWLSHNPGEYGPVMQTRLGLHFTTARPMEVRLRLPLEHVAPDYSGPAARPGAQAAWVFDRLYLKASTIVVGAKFGVGNVRAGICPRTGYWMVELFRESLHVAFATERSLIYRFAADVDRVCPEPRIDVDPWIEQLLGTS